MVEDFHIFARCPLESIYLLYVQLLAFAQRTLLYLLIHNDYYKKSKGPIGNQLLKLKKTNTLLIIYIRTQY